MSFRKLYTLLLSMCDTHLVCLSFSLLLRNSSAWTFDVVKKRKRTSFQLDLLHSQQQTLWKWEEVKKEEESLALIFPCWSDDDVVAVIAFFPFLHKITCVCVCTFYYCLFAHKVQVIKTWDDIRMDISLSLLRCCLNAQACVSAFFSVEVSS